MRNNNIHGSLPFPLPKSSPFIQRRGKLLKSSMDDGINLKYFPAHQIIIEKQYQSKKRIKTQNNNLFPSHLIQARLIYTEWANHHLLRAKLPPLTDLTGELCLPHKLIPFIYSIIVEFNSISLEQLMAKMSAEKPVISIEKCLNFCQGIGVHIEDIKPRDIRNGHLGAILQFLHHLSEYKRQQRKISEEKNIFQRRVRFNNNQNKQSPKHLSKPSYSSYSSENCCSSSSGYGSVCNNNNNNSTIYNNLNNNNNYLKVIKIFFK
ncbi:Calponin-homology [Meloidogyne graminicola]|uniref:Calponin-homology n=1 Tax=Meloidogyne graminicola TaxID=189291 RepID=A0A8S9ZPZ4_9BILA|nr:Calponin-homology [Meloidogyne graminicola]